MKQEIIPTPDNTTVDPGCAQNDNFKGYTIEELRYQRALVALQKEFCKTKVLHKCNKLRNHKLLGNDNSGSMSKFARVGSIATKVFSGLNYLDYFMIGMSVFGSARKVFKFIRGKRR